MQKISCELCGKEFKSKSYYTQHQKRKTPCVTQSKIKEVAPVESAINITIETSTFDEIKKYYDDILNIDKILLAH